MANKLEQKLQDQLAAKMAEQSNKRKQNHGEDVKKESLAADDPIEVYFSKMKNYSPRRAEAIKKNLKSAGVTTKNDLNLFFNMSPNEIEDFMRKNPDDMKSIWNTIKEKETKKVEPIEDIKRVSNWSDLNRLVKSGNVEHQGSVYGFDNLTKDLENIENGKSSPDILPPILRAKVLELMSKKDDTSKTFEIEEKEAKKFEVENEGEVETWDNVEVIDDADNFEMTEDEAAESELADFFEREDEFSELRGDANKRALEQHKAREAQEKIEGMKQALEESRRLYVDLDYDMDKHSSVFRKIFGLGKRSEMGQSSEEFEDAKSRYQEDVRKYVKVLIESGTMENEAAEIGNIVLQERMNYNIERSEVRMEKSPNLSGFENFWNNRFDEYKSLSWKKKALYGVGLIGAGFIAGASGGAFAAGAAGGAMLAKRLFGAASLGAGVKSFEDARLERKDEKWVSEGRERHVTESGAESVEEKRRAMLEFFDDEISNLDQTIQTLKMKKIHNVWKGVGASVALTAAGPALGKIFGWASGTEIVQSLSSSSIGKEYGLVSAGIGKFVEEHSEGTYNKELAKSIVLDQPDTFSAETTSIDVPVLEDTSKIPVLEDTSKVPVLDDAVKRVAEEGAVESTKESVNAVAESADIENPKEPVEIETEVSGIEKADFGINNALLAANKLGISAQDYSRINGIPIARLLEEYPEMTSEQGESFDFGRPADILKSGSAEQKVAEFIRETSSRGIEFDGLNTVDELLRENEFKDLFAGESAPEGSMGLFQDNLVRFETGELRMAIFENLDKWREVVNIPVQSEQYGELMSALSEEAGINPDPGENMNKWTYRLTQAAVEKGKMEDLMRIIEENK
ncbi:hypothetical protein ACFL08_04275 [Patescibacteria group bacterium]